MIHVDARDHDISKRLLLLDLPRIPSLLKSGQARLSDYKRDWIGLVASIVFVVAFIRGVDWLGSFI